jgi:chaperonin GroEL
VSVGRQVGAERVGGVGIVQSSGDTARRVEHCVAAVEGCIHHDRGVALIRAQKALANQTGANEDQSIGIKLLSRAIEEPLRRIVTNAGEDAAVLLAKVKDGKGTFGYNAGTGAYGGMPDMGGMGDMGM